MAAKIYQRVPQQLEAESVDSLFGIPDPGFFNLFVTAGQLPRLAGVTSHRRPWLGPGRAGQDAAVAGEVDARFGVERPTVR